MSFEIIKSSKLEEKLENGKITILNFYADWCGPCQMLGPILEDLGNDEYQVLKINVDTDKEKSMEFGVKGIPATFIFNGKTKMNSDPITGFMPKENWISEINKLIK